MKCSIVFVAITFLVTTAIQAQDITIAEKHLTLKATVKPDHGDQIKGWLGNIEDSAILLSDFPVTVSPGRKQEYPRRIDYSKIYSVKTQRKGSVGRGILFGALAGFTIGAIAGYASGDDPPNTNVFDVLPPQSAGEKAILAGGAGILVGGGIGAIIGALVHKTYIIGGNKEKFQEMKLSVLERIYSN